MSDNVIEPEVVIDAPDQSSTVVNLGVKRLFMLYLHAMDQYNQGTPLIPSDRFMNLKRFLTDNFKDFPGLQINGAVTNEHFDEAYKWLGDEYEAGRPSLITLEGKISENLLQWITK